MTTPYDIVVVGATGTTGREVVRYLDARAPGNLRWAMAARDRAKLDGLANHYGIRADRLVVDIDDHRAVDELVSRTRVVLNLAGPFALHAEPLIRACAHCGVDYVDITGETAHVRRMIDRHHEEARRTGARIVPFCGFDSVPSDLGVLLLVDHFRRRGLDTREVKGFIRATGGVGPGTIASTLALLGNEDDVRAMRDPELLSAARRRDSHAPVDIDPAAPMFAAEVQTWVGPSPMAPINTRVVRRSAMLAAESNRAYGAAFRYVEYWDPGGAFSWLTAGAAAWMTAAYQLAATTPGAVALFAPYANVAASPQGPPTEAYFRARFVGTAHDGSTVHAEVADFGDPASDITAKIASESALALAIDRDTLPEGGGLLTPASALGAVLTQRLRDAGMTLRLTACRP